MKKLTYEEIALQRLSPKELQKTERFPISVIIENMRSAYNVGSVFRTSDGARIEKLFLCGNMPFPPHREIEKTALGSVQTVPWEYKKNTMNIVEQLKKKNITICVVEHTDASVPYYTLDKKIFPLCLVVGNEIAGVSDEVISAADIAIEIPMYGMKQSLNAASAYSITVFDIIRKIKTE
ncbi:MAG: RNA methyltransferase [Ignavibacteria bacterium]|nr:RNA methyltransferase [Ignavibacteria bacterium]